MDPAIQQFILNMPLQKQDIILAIRDIFLSEDPKITEKIKWKQLTFSYGKYNMAFIYSFPDLDYLNLGFFDAVSLNDPKKLFEGTGNRMRHIKLRTVPEIPEEQLRLWIQEAKDLKSV